MQFSINCDIIPNMQIKTSRSKLQGHITVPGSKSHTIRALILASMAEGISNISNPLPSNDCHSTAKAIKQIGADVTFDNNNNVWSVQGAGKKLHLPQEQIDVGNSGSLMYFLCPVLSTFDNWCTFTGDESIQTRPVKHLIDSINQLNGHAECIKPESVTPPFKFKGPISNKITLKTDGQLSQYISGFMMAATRLTGDFNIELTDPKETPYLTMTQKWLETVGTKVTISDDYKHICVKGPVDIKAFNTTIPSDWEAVAFPLIAALMTDSEITIDNIDAGGSQGDSKIVEILQSVGADIEWNKTTNQLIIKGGKKLTTENLPDKQLKINISAFPDAICALSVIACFIEGKTVITDIEICRKKETDRIACMISELTKLGATLYEENDSLIINGTGLKHFHGATVESYKDHRIAMSLACLGLALPENEHLYINDAESCSVSFPGFFEKMKALNADFTEN